MRLVLCAALLVAAWPLGATSAVAQVVAGAAAPATGAIPVAPVTPIMPSTLITPANGAAVPAALLPSSGLFSPAPGVSALVPTAKPSVLSSQARGVVAAVVALAASLVAPAVSARPFALPAAAGSLASSRTAPVARAAGAAPAAAGRARGTAGGAWTLQEKLQARPQDARSSLDSFFDARAKRSAAKEQPEVWSGDQPVIQGSGDDRLKPSELVRPEGGLRNPPVDRLSFIKDPEARKALTGTWIFKFGMETLNVTMPLIALSVFGSAVWIATMAAAWGASMTVASMLAGGAIDRRPVQKVLSGALIAQAVFVAGIIGLLAVGVTNPLLILPLYAASGATMGIVVTARDTIPARILGRDHGSLSRFNATTHIVYETAGTIAPLLVGLLIRQFGLTAALLIHPPAYLLAALFFSRMKLGAPASAGVPQTASPEGGLRALLKRTVADIKEGGKLLLGSKEFRLLSFMLLLPMVVHRVFEQIVVPVFVRSIGAKSGSAWIVSGSNFGEFLGALLLLKALMGTGPKEKPSRFKWIPWMAAGTLAVWSLSAGAGLWLVIPAIFVMSLTWALNDLNMTAYFQSRLPSEKAGKAIGALMAAEMALIMAGSYTIGLAADFLPAKWLFLGVNALLTALAFVFWRGRDRLRKTSDATR